MKVPEPHAVSPAGGLGPGGAPPPVPVEALEVVDVAPVAVVAPVVVAIVVLDVVAMPLEVVDEVTEDDELDAPPFAVLALPPLHPNVATTVSAAPQSRTRCMARFDARRLGSIHPTSMACPGAPCAPASASKALYLQKLSALLQAGLFSEHEAMG